MTHKADGSWGAKEKKDYARDENGDRIPLIDKKTGKQKLGKRNEKLWKRITVQANNWNDRSNVEKWSTSWADICNRYLSVEQQIDHRSYKRQGLPLEPTMHEGFCARQMEQRGGVSDRYEYNRIVKQLNSVTKEWFQLMKALHQMIMEKVGDFIGRIYNRVARGSGYSGKAGRDSGTGGKPADGNRASAIREQGTFRVASAKEAAQIKREMQKELQKKSDMVLRKQSKQLSGMTIVLLVAYLVQLAAFLFLERNTVRTIPVWFCDRYGDFLWLTQRIGDFYQSLYMKMATGISTYAAIGILVFEFWKVMLV